MDIMTIFWIFIMLTALQPVVKQKLLENARQKLIASLEKKRGSRVILLIHRQETMSLLGFPVLKYITIEDSEEVIRAIQMTDPNIPIDLVLHTPGGLVLASYQIAHAIKYRPGKVTVHVPHFAMSGGTLIALAADEIVMGDHAMLGPVDPQIGEYPAASLVKLVQAKPIADIDDRTWILADMGKKAMDQLREHMKELLAEHFSPERAEELARTMTEGRWTHDFPITFEEAQGLGLQVAKGLSDEFYQLMSLYPQPMKRQPTVEYIPLPKFKEPKQKTE
jgi:ClpP class serine protease